MTRDQIDHLRQWLENHESYNLKVVTHSNKIFLKLIPSKFKDDEKEAFYVPLNYLPIKKSKEESH